MDYESIVKDIESLPPLSDSAILVNRLYSEGAENVDIIKLVRIIESDALLSLNILKMINAPFYGFSKKIASVSQAVSLFGTRTVYGLVISYAMNQTIKANTNAYNISSSKFNDMCLLQSYLMMQWYAKIDLRHAQFLTPLSLIMESGKLIISQVISKNKNIKEFQKGIKECEYIEEYEFELIGTSSYYLSGLLFEHWNLEPLFVVMLKNLDFEGEDLGEKMDSYIDTLDVIRTAVNVRELLTDQSIAEASEMVKTLELDEHHFQKVAYRIKKSYEKKQKSGEN